MKRGGIGAVVGATLALLPVGRAAAAPAETAPTPPPQGGADKVVILTLEEAIRIALANNPNLQATLESQRQARARIGSARAAAGPSIDATAGYVRQGPIPEFTFSAGPGEPSQRVRLGSPQTRTAEVSGTYIPDLSGQISASVRGARAGAEAAEAATATTFNELTFQVQNAYYTVLRTDSLVEVRQQAVAAAQEQLRVARAEVRAGTKPEFDALRASVQVENQRQSLIQAQNNARIAIIDLINVLGIDPTAQLRLTPAPVTPLPPPIPFGAPRQPPANGQPQPQPPANATPPPAEPRTVIPRPPEEGAAPADAPPQDSLPPAAVSPPAARPLPTTEAAAFAEALAERPEVQQAQETVRQERARVAFEQRARRPELAVTGAYTLTPDSQGLAAEDEQWRVGASLSLNLFDAGLTRSRVREARAGREAAEARLEQVRQQVAQQVRTALLNLREAAERRQTTAANVQQAQEALRIAQVRYRAGVGTNVEVTDAQVALTEAQSNQVNAEYDHLNAQAALARALGRYAPETAGRATPPAGGRK